jgi:hypothetical protein
MKPAFTYNHCMYSIVFVGITYTVCEDEYGRRRMFNRDHINEIIRSLK